MTRPCRSGTQQVDITLRKYAEHASVKNTENDFPTLPDYTKLSLVQKFQSVFVEAFEILESNT